jgi:hypothetical protein
MIKLTAYHSTATKNVRSILKDGFKLSTGKQHDRWLGDGAYFFIEGVQVKPDELVAIAEKWAIVGAWDNELRKNTYNQYSILEVEVRVSEDNFLDLTTPDGLAVFNYLRDKYVQTLQKANIRLTSGDFKDGHIINDAVLSGILSPIEIDAVKGNFFIQLSKAERVHNSQFRTPNCTILAVRRLDCIQNVTVVKSGVL